MRINIGRWNRIASIAAGAGLLYVGSRQKRGSQIAWSTGVGLVLRGVAGYCPVTALAAYSRSRDTRTALGGPRGVHVRESVDIDANIRIVYRFWRNLSNLPRFMKHLTAVTEIDEKRSHWIAAAPAGMSVEWDAEIINDIENRLIAWKSLEHADVVSAGSVQFRQAPRGGTRVAVNLQYDPPGGKLGAWLAAAFGQAPEQVIRQDLSYLKVYLEAPRVAAG